MARTLQERIDATGEFARSPDREVFDLVAAEIGPQMEQAGISSAGDVRDSGRTDRFLEGLRLVVRYAPGLKFVGEGSSRYVYELPSGKYVLKAAKNYMGLLQNSNEIAANMAGSADYDCFVRVLAYDPAMVLLVEDRCREIRMAEWAPLLGVSLHRFVQIVRVALERNTTVGSLLKTCEEKGASSPEVRALFRPKEGTPEPDYSPSDFPGVVSFMRNMKAAAEGRPAAELWRSLFDVFRFYEECGPGKLEVGELPWPEQWGLCGEGKDVRIVLVDPGVGADFAP